MMNLHEKITIVSKLEHEIGNMKNGNKVGEIFLNKNYLYH